jgi:hypothetical protein
MVFQRRREPYVAAEWVGVGLPALQILHRRQKWSRWAAMRTVQGRPREWNPITALSGSKALVGVGRLGFLQVTHSRRKAALPIAVREGDAHAAKTV